MPGITDTEAHEVATRLNKQGEVVTKADLTKLDTKLTAEIEAIKVEIKSIKWMFGVVFALNLAMFIKLFF